MVGLVWNFSHKLTMMMKAATAPMATKQNHINLKFDEAKMVFVMLVHTE
jgi:hypothetical protein